MMKKFGWGLSAGVAVVALALTTGVASAQQKAPDAPAKTEAKKVEPPKTDAKKAEPAAKAPAKKAEPAKKAPSPCAGIEETACLANNECMWVKEVVTKAGQKRKAHCQKKPTPPAAKKSAAPAAPAAKAAAPAAPAPKAAAPAPAAPAPAAPKAPEKK